MKTMQEVGIKPPRIPYRKLALSHQKNRAGSRHKTIMKTVQEIGITPPQKRYRKPVLNHHKTRAGNRH